jgi:anaerobic magnesium-protoporphyrin IX monomethyl ester cyclase
MKIGFIFPNKDRRYKTVHLGLAYLAAFARQQHADLEFQVLDTRVATKKETQRFFNSSFDLIGMTVFSPVYFEVINLFNRIKKIYPAVPVCFGGPYVTTIMEEIFKETPVDFAVYGEGEITFSELIFHLKGERGLEHVNGLMFRDNFGKIVINKPREQIRDLDILPMPAYDLFPMERYPLHRIVSSRGCPYSCSFCNSTSIWSMRWRKRSPVHIVEEIEYLIKIYGKKIFIFGDNTFNADAKRLEEFCDLLIAKNTCILWSASIRADIITRNLANKMKASGCYNVAVGIESANNFVLQAMNKKTTIEEITKGITVLKKAGIEVLGQFVIGSPGDTFKTINESIEYAKNSELDFVNFYTVLPFKGTPQWKYIQNFGHFFSTTIHEFHSMKPRIVFDTPEFPFIDRVRAIKLATKAGYNSNKDKKNIWFDLIKNLSVTIQKILPATIGNKIFMIMKSVYRIRLVKKYNN